jgi:hypothetical protein
LAVNRNARHEVDILLLELKKCGDEKLYKAYERASKHHPESNPEKYK